MTLIADVREKDEWLRGQCDRVELLAYDGDKSYDYRVEVKGGLTYRFERKRFPDDFIGTWRRGDLERQLEHVDCLIVERDPVSDSLSGWEPKVIADAVKHVARLSSQMWVVQTSGPRETYEVLRYVERQKDLVVRRNKVRGASLDLRHRMLDCIRGVDCSRVFKGGARVGDVISGNVDWKALFEALHVHDWPEGEFRDGGKFRFKLRAQESLYNALVKK